MFVVYSCEAFGAYGDPVFFKYLENAEKYRDDWQEEAEDTIMLEEIATED